MPVERINAKSNELDKSCLNQVDNTKKSSTKPPLGGKIEESKIISMFEKAEKENGERVTRLSNNMSSQIISCMLESENKQDNRIKQIVCTEGNYKISVRTSTSYYSHQLSPDLISKLK